jgi:hypothetical protein
VGRLFLFFARLVDGCACAGKRCRAEGALGPVLGVVDLGLDGVRGGLCFLEMKMCIGDMR